MPTSKEMSNKASLTVRVFSSLGMVMCSKGYSRMEYARGEDE